MVRITFALAVVVSLGIRLIVGVAVSAQENCGTQCVTHADVHRWSLILLAAAVLWPAVEFGRRLYLNRARPTS
jgi:hypothetical protein